MFQNKNLLIIAHSYENFIKDQVDIIAKQFNQVYVLVRYNSLFELVNSIPLSRIENILDNYTIKNKLNLSNKPKNVKVILTPTNYIPINIFYKNLGSTHFKSVDNIIKQNNIKFDIIHSHFIWSSGYVGLKLKQKYNVPLIITGHGYDVYSLPFQNQYMKTQIIDILNKTDQIITVSQNNYNIIRKLQIKTPINIIANGFDSKIFHTMDKNNCKNKLKISSDKITILSVGNLIPIKGHIYLINAMKEILKKRKDVQCIIIGNGELKNTLQKHVEHLNLTENIKLLGSKPHNEIPLWMNASDLFALPSLNEGNPTVMFESLACGCPFIGSNVGGIPDIITSPDYGSTTRPSDPIDLKNKLLWAIEQKWSRDKISQYALNYTWQNLSNQILIVYDKALAKNNP